MTNQGLFEPTVMFFRLINSPATFQTMIDMIFHEQIMCGTLIVYMDDILVHTKWRPEELEEQHSKQHHELIREMLTILCWLNLYLNIKKCQFKQTEVNYLGVWVEGKHISIKEAKIKKVKDWKPPQNTIEVQCFLGFMGYYHYFIKRYSQIAWPLLDLTKKATSWHWGESQQKAFDKLKTRMCNWPFLMNPDQSKMFYLQTGASSIGAGAVLTQEVEGSKKCKPVTYFSCIFSPAESNYNIYEKEFLAVIKAIKHWRAHLIWTEKPFIIETDHKNLTY
jgi:RNase H-like domain found in reverse transcriptase/Reverse transcriptase (RNA-dependent DNA polymerase)